MKLDMKMFSGAANVHNGVLASVLMALAASQGKASAAVLNDLTDNSGATIVDGTVSAIVLPPLVAASATRAYGTLTLTGQPLNGETVTVDGKVYTFQTVLTNVNGNVLIGANAGASLDNLTAAASLGTGAGATYAAAMTAHPTVSFIRGVGLTITLAAKTAGTGGNALATTETLTNGSFGGATLAGGLATGAAQKAATEAALVTAKNALTEIAAQIAALHGRVPTNTLVNNLGGAGADRTIDPVTRNLVGVNASYVSGAGLQAVGVVFINTIATLVRQTNELCRATGIPELVDNSGGQAAYGPVTLAALSTDTGTAVSGADATPANATAAPTDVNKFLHDLADAVGEMAAKLNAMTSDAVQVPTLMVG